MALIPPVTKQLPVASTPHACFWAEHDGKRVIKRNGDTASVFHTSNQLICGDTKADVDAQIATLKLPQ